MGNWQVITFAVTILATVATILAVKEPRAKAILLSILSLIALLSVVLFLNERLTNGPNTNNANSDDRRPSPSPTTQPTPPQPTPTPTPSLQPSPSPAPSPSLSIEVGSGSDVTQPTPKTIHNEIGQTKTNEFYEMTLENARVSTGQIRFDICFFNIPSGNKAILVRFALRRSASRMLSGEEFMRVGSVRTSDFVVIDDQNRRIDTACQQAGFVIGQNAIPRTLGYLVPVTSQHLSFRFQKAGAGEAIIFDLSDLD